MNGKLARRLRKLAKLEMSSNKETVERELVLATVKGHDRVINEPLSVRAFYLKLKDAYDDSKRTGHKARQNQSD